MWRLRNELQEIRERRSTLLTSGSTQTSRPLRLWFKPKARNVRLSYSSLATRRKMEQNSSIRSHSLSVFPEPNNERHSGRNLKKTCECWALINRAGKTAYIENNLINWAILMKRIHPEDELIETEWKFGLTWLVASYFASKYKRRHQKIPLNRRIFIAYMVTLAISIWYARDTKSFEESQSNFFSRSSNLLNVNKRKQLVKAHWPKWTWGKRVEQRWRAQWKSNKTDKMRRFAILKLSNQSPRRTKPRMESHKTFFTVAGWLLFVVVVVVSVLNKGRGQETAVSSGQVFPPIPPAVLRTWPLVTHKLRGVFFRCVIYCRLRLEQDVLVRDWFRVDALVGWIRTDDGFVLFVSGTDSLDRNAVWVENNKNVPADCFQF